MKTDIELLELLKTFIQYKLKFGLCFCTIALYMDRDIDRIEQKRLNFLIELMKPKEKPKELSLRDWNYGYYWDVRELEPRVNAINELIKLRQAT